MEKLKDMKIKHDHTLTDIVKVVVFWLFLIMPILVWMPTALYYGFNEHADNGTQTATANIEYQYKYQTNEVNSLNDIVANNVYHFTNLNVPLTSIGQNLSLEINCLQYETSYTGNLDVERYDESLPIDSYNYVNCLVAYSIEYDGNDVYFDFLFKEGTNYSMYDLLDLNTFVFSSLDFYVDTNNLQKFKTFLTLTNQGLPTSSTYNVIESATATIEYNNNNSIVNAMSYAWQQTWQTPVLSWTGNQNFNFTIQAFTNVFGINQESYITNYLTYLLTMTAIYIIFDIVLGVFKLITHIVNEK